MIDIEYENMLLKKLYERNQIIIAQSRKIEELNQFIEELKKEKADV